MSELKKTLSAAIGGRENGLPISSPISTWVSMTHEPDLT